MKRNLLSLHIGLCVFMLLISCVTNDGERAKQDVKMNVVSDTVVKDIPTDGKGKPRSFYRNKEIVEKKVGLRTLENGYDSIQIRIWYGYAFNDTSQLIQFKKTQGAWFGDFFTLKYNFNVKGDSVMSIDKSIISREPKSGWEIFVKQMLDLEILTLPDYKDIPNYLQTADGDAVIIEVATQKLYRIYSYQAPNMNKLDHWQAKNIEDILELIEDEFNFPRLRKL